MPTTETTRVAQVPPLPLYLLAITLSNGIEGYFDGTISLDEGRLVPGVVVNLAANEGDAARLLDHAWRDGLFAAYRVAQAIKDYGMEGLTIQLVEYHPTGGAA